VARGELLEEVMRLKTWTSRFAALVESARARPFEWGSHDCCLWGADAVQALTGHDPGAQWRGTYDDAKGALRLLESLGGIEQVAALAGPEIPVLMATSGDAAVIDAGAEDGSLSIGICGGDHWLVVGETGLLRFPFDAARRTWRVA
jgi:hypothetical protein